MVDCRLGQLVEPQCAIEIALVPACVASPDEYGRAQMRCKVASVIQVFKLRLALLQLAGANRQVGGVVIELEDMLGQLWLRRTRFSRITR